MNIAIVYKMDVVYQLKKKGFTTVKMKDYKLLSQSVIQNLRKGKSISFDSLGVVCFLLQKQPGDILGYVSEGAPTLQRTPQEEFMYLYEIWDRTDRASGKPFNLADYKHHLPVPDTWRSPLSD